MARRDKKAFFRDQYKEIMENNRIGKSGDLFKKIRDTKGTFHAKIHTKGQKWYGPNRSRRDGTNTQKNYTKKIFMTQISTMVCSLTQSQTSWNAKSSGP